AAAFGEMPPSPAQTPGAAPQQPTAATRQADPGAVGRTQIAYPHGGVTFPGLQVSAGEVPVSQGQIGPALRAGRLCTVAAPRGAGLTRADGRAEVATSCPAGLTRAARLTRAAVLTRAARPTKVAELRMARFRMGSLWMARFCKARLWMAGLTGAFAPAPAADHRSAWQQRDDEATVRAGDHGQMVAGWNVHPSMLHKNSGGVPMPVDIGTPPRERPPRSHSPRW